MQDIQDVTPLSSSFVVDMASCTGCGICVAVCPVDCICIEEFKASFLPITATACFQCGACQCACPRNAIQQTL